MIAPLCFSALPAVNGSVLAFWFKMDGPDFLALFLLWFALVLGSVLVLRRCGFDNWATTILGLLFFESLGAVRLITGSADGQKNWDLLVLMMFFGSLFFLIRAKHFQRSNNAAAGSSSCSSVTSCSSGGGDSGGGCGGGGGGCGGCGS